MKTGNTELSYQKNNKDLRLVQECIAHWSRMRDRTDIPNVYGEEPGPRTCSLCKHYRGVISVTCQGCPIKEDTGETACKKTPYRDAEYAIEMLHRQGTPSNRLEWSYSSQLEIDYLRKIESRLEKLLFSTESQVI